jgi:hypothetical protein
MIITVNLTLVAKLWCDWNVAKFMMYMFCLVGILASLVCMRLAIVWWAVIERFLCFVTIGDARTLRLFEHWMPQIWLLISAF